jgi:hypothetical protein
MTVVSKCVVQDPCHSKKLLRTGLRKSHSDRVLAHQALGPRFHPQQCKTNEQELKLDLRAQRAKTYWYFLYSMLKLSWAWWCTPSIPGLQTCLGYITSLRIKEKGREGGKEEGTRKKYLKIGNF